LCYEYENAISLEEVDVWYGTIHYWWYSLKAIDEARLQELENWLYFWHFCVRRWGGFMIYVLFSTFPHIYSFTPSSQQLRIYGTNHFKIAQPKKQMLFQKHLQTCPCATF
jgi:hypothetical protein